MEFHQEFTGSCVRLLDFSPPPPPPNTHTHTRTICYSPQCSVKLLQVNTPIKQRLAGGPLNPALAISLPQIYSEQSNNQGRGAHYCRPLCSDVFPAKEETDLVTKPATLYDWGEVTHTRVSTYMLVSITAWALLLMKSNQLLLLQSQCINQFLCVSLCVVKMETKHVCHRVWSEWKQSSTRKDVTLQINCNIHIRTLVQSDL